METQEKLSADNFFTIIPEWVLFSDISAQAIRLYGVLRRYADRDGTCFPSRKRLASDLRVESVKPVDKALKELVVIGAVTITNRYTDQGDLQSNLYVVLSSPQGSDEKLPTSIPFGPHGGSRNIPTLVAKNSQITRANLNESQDNEKTYNDDVIVLCNLLADLMTANGVKRPTISGKWYSDMDKLIRIDEKTAQQVEKAIRWSQQDSFWSSNIHSPAALRKQYEKMRMQAIRQNGQGVDAVRSYINNLGDTNE